MRFCKGKVGTWHDLRMFCSSPHCSAPGCPALVLTCPALQVIDLMMQTSTGPDVENAATATAVSASTLADQQHAEGPATADAQDDNAAASSYSSSEAGSSSGVSGSGSESDDEMDLSELQALCGDAVGPDTPLSVILGMMLTPQAGGLTAALAAPSAAGGAAAEDLNPRVLFADE